MINQKNTYRYFILFLILVFASFPHVAAAQTQKQINDVWEITSSMEIPASKILKVGKNGRINIAKGNILTIRGRIDASPTRIFYGDGEVVFDSDDRKGVYPQWWGARGDGVTDDSAAVQAAINSFSAKGGVIRFPEGSYLVNNVGMKSNIALVGSGANSILKQKSGASCALSTKPNNPGINHARNYSDTPENISFDELTFRGSVDTDGFREFFMLLRLDGVHNVTIRNCQFIGFRGDGVYIGAYGTSHSGNIRIVGCLFDGINRENRNGISVIDCDGLIVQNCEFKNIARSNMPGAIDVEPDSASDIVRNITIDGNRFSKIGGGNIIQISVTSNVVKQMLPLKNVTIVNNSIMGDGTSNGIYVCQAFSHTSNTQGNNVLIRGNKVFNTQRAFMLWGLKQTVLQDNVFDGCENASYISYSEKDVNVMDMKITGNTFHNLSQSDGMGIYIFGAEVLEISNNTFDNIGKRDGSGGNALNFKSNGGATRAITIQKNIFKGTRTKIAIQRDRYQITDPEQNSIKQNEFGGMKALLPGKQF